MHLTDAMTKLQSLYAAAPQALLTEALLLCARGCIMQLAEGATVVRYGGPDDREDIATVEGGACDCDPLAETRQVCAHVIAASLYELLREEKPTLPLDGPLLERHIERVVSGSLMSEAPYSVNMTVEDADGYNLMFTVRKQDGKEFFEAATALRGWIKKQGFTPKKQWQAAVQEVQASTQSVTPSTTSGASVSAQKTYLFHAETLHKSDMDGKILFSIKGPDMPAWNRQYGMRAWQEVLAAAGFNVAELERLPNKELPSLHGYVATYVMRKDDPEKPDKVTYLSKGT